ncbi:MAG: hypothetical protein M3347_03805, partial [Armatimonadota bacterium]|nr:hypothetical protein [Armatimonadota bacterium]
MSRQISKQNLCNMRGVATLLIALAPLLLGCGACLAAPGPGFQGLAFSVKSNVYDLDISELNVWDDVSVELWLQPAPNCPAGAVIVDKLGP